MAIQVKLDETRYQLLVGNDRIEDQIVKMAEHLNYIHRNDPAPTTAVCVLNGGFMFYTKLVSLLSFNVNVDFCKIASYNGQDKKHEYDIQRFKEGEYEIAIPEGHRILIIDDIVDSGDTALRLAEYYQANFNPMEMVLCSLVRRSDMTPVLEQLEQHYSSIHSALLINDWICGYGMDDSKGEMRNVSAIYKELNTNA